LPQCLTAPAFSENEIIDFFSLLLRSKSRRSGKKLTRYVIFWRVGFDNVPAQARVCCGPVTFAADQPEDKSARKRKATILAREVELGKYLARMVDTPAARLWATLSWRFQPHLKCEGFEIGFVVRFRYKGLVALIAYLGLSVGVFGRQLLFHPGTCYVGEGTDASPMMWLLVWWPYALIHGSNPFLSHAVWAPSGVNLAWMTCIPGPSLLAFPVTYAFGPVVSYNVLSLLAPALSSWAAYYLCLSLTRSFGTSLIGGYLYGFSSYEVGQVLAGHLSLSLVFLPPILLTLFLRLAAKAITCRQFVVCFSILLSLQFLISNEVFATATVFGVSALLLAWCIGGPLIRAALRHAIPAMLVSYILTVLAISPYLYYMFAYPMPAKPLYPPEFYSADLAGFVLPNILNYFRFPFLSPDTRRFLIDPWENGAYLGIPVLTLIVWYVGANWRSLAAKLLGAFFILVCLAALGPVLHIAGRPSIALPWMAAARLPLIEHALPGRFMLYAFLAIAIAASLWLARTRGGMKIKVVLLTICIVSLWPAVTISRTTIPQFFSTGTYKHFLHRDETVLIVPFGRTGESMLWQAESLMYFRMAGGWLGPTPPEFEHWPIVQALLSSVLMPKPDWQLKAFVGRYGIQTVLLDDANRGPWRRLFSTLDSAPVRLGGVTIYRVASAEPNGFGRTNPVQAEGFANLARFREMLAATTGYLQRGLDPAKLNCARAQELGLMPDRRESSSAASQLGWCYSMWFGVIRGEDIGLGLIGDYAGLKPLIAAYTPYTKSILFPYPQKISDHPDPNQIGALMMIFDRSQLALAAAYSDRTNQDRPMPRPAYSSPSGNSAPMEKTSDSPTVALPVITAVDGIAELTLSRAHVGSDVQLPVLPARQGFWVPWWRGAEDQQVVVIHGRNFDTKFGVAVELHCECPGGVRPFFFEPYYNSFDKSHIFFSLPRYGAKAPPNGPGSIVVSNKGRDGQYAAKSNRVRVWIGNPPRQGLNNQSQ
jgi:hypothetical protein